MDKAHDSGKDTQTPPPALHPPVAVYSASQLQAMTTAELTRLLMSRDTNFALRRQVIALLQQREGNDFVRRLLAGHLEAEVK